jgi:hypothetical protein
MARRVNFSRQFNSLVAPLASEYLGVSGVQINFLLSREVKSDVSSKKKDDVNR